MKSLYREYRPKNFSEVVGQKHITQILQNQIKQNKISHAYLFCGTRGTGKTSVAKIFARAVNDTKNSEIDIFEIDAASNNSVQDVRDIIDRVKFPPIVGKYKIYIIDEVHMFSQSAFNALLKTLEEPPEHVIFILCTTEPHKLLPTVQSRCLRFDFRPAAIGDIERVIKSVLKSEHATAAPDAVKIIASSGNGSFRDALSTLETVLNFAHDREVTAADVTTILGSVDGETLLQLLQSIESRDAKRVTNQVHQIFENGININVLLKAFIDIIKMEFLNRPNIGYIFRAFCELELSIKNATNVQTMFENTALLLCARE